MSTPPQETEQQIHRLRPRVWRWGEPYRTQEEERKLWNAACKLRSRFPQLCKQSEIADTLVAEFGIETTPEQWADAGRYASTRRRLLKVFGLGPVAVGIILNILDAEGIPYKPEPDADPVGDEVARVNNARKRLAEKVAGLGGAITWNDPQPIARARVAQREQQTARRKNERRLDTLAYIKAQQAELEKCQQSP